MFFTIHNNAIFEKSVQSNTKLNVLIFFLRHCLQQCLKKVYPINPKTSQSLFCSKKKKKVLSTSLTS